MKGYLISVVFPDTVSRGLQKAVSCEANHSAAAIASFATKNWHGKLRNLVHYNEKRKKLKWKYIQRCMPLLQVKGIGRFFIKQGWPLPRFDFLQMRMMQKTKKKKGKKTEQILQRRILRKTKTTIK
jgi:hypothetical protein